MPNGTPKRKNRLLRPVFFITPKPLARYCFPGLRKLHFSPFLWASGRYIHIKQQKPHIGAFNWYLTLY